MTSELGTKLYNIMIELKNIKTVSENKSLSVEVFVLKLQLVLKWYSNF